MTDKTETPEGTPEKIPRTARDGRTMHANSFKNLNRGHLKHGAFCESVAMTPEQKQSIEQFRTYCMSLHHIYPCDLILVNRASKKLERLLKLDSWEALNPERIEYGHDIFKISLENSFVRDLDRLGLNPLSRRTLRIDRTSRKELSRAQEITMLEQPEQSETPETPENMETGDQNNEKPDIKVN